MKKEQAIELLSALFKCGPTPTELSKHLGVTPQSIGQWGDDLTNRNLRNIAGGIVQAGRRIPAEIVSALRAK